MVIKEIDRASLFGWQRSVKFVDDHIAQSVDLNQVGLPGVTRFSAFSAAHRRQVSSCFYRCFTNYSHLCLRRVFDSQIDAG
jgi:hypothetical protein